MTIVSLCEGRVAALPRFTVPPPTTRLPPFPSLHLPLPLLPFGTLFESSLLPLRSLSPSQSVESRASALLSQDACICSLRIPLYPRPLDPPYPSSSHLPCDVSLEETTPRRQPAEKTLHKARRPDHPSALAPSRPLQPPAFLPKVCKASAAGILSVGAHESVELCRSQRRARKSF